MRVKGKIRVNERDIGMSVFDSPPIQVGGLFSFSFNLACISMNKPISKEPKIIFGKVRTEYATIVGYIAHESNAINFYEEFLKNYDGSDSGPVFLHTGINGKILIIMKTEYAPREAYNGSLDEQLDAMPFNTEGGKSLGSIGILLPSDYFQKHMVKSK